MSTNSMIPSRKETPAAKEVPAERTVSSAITKLAPGKPTP